MHTPPEPSKGWRHNQTHCQIQNQTRIRFNFHNLSSNQGEFHNQFHFDMVDLYVGFDVKTLFSRFWQAWSDTNRPSHKHSKAPSSTFQKHNCLNKIEVPRCTCFKHKPWNSLMAFANRNLPTTGRKNPCSDFRLHPSSIGILHLVSLTLVLLQVLPHELQLSAYGKDA